MLTRKRPQSAVKGIEIVKELIKEKEKKKELEKEKLIEEPVKPPVNKSFVSFLYLVFLFWEAGAAFFLQSSSMVFFFYIETIE